MPLSSTAPYTTTPYTLTPYTSPSYIPYLGLTTPHFTRPQMEPHREEIYPATRTQRGVGGTQRC
jgi:hypothetical protein